MNSKVYVSGLIGLIIWTFLLSCNQPAAQNTVSKDPALQRSELEQMAGQMVMIGFRGMTITELDSSLHAQIKNGLVGGIILFDYDLGSKKAHRNIQSPGQVGQLITDLQKIAPTPLLMAVDQEGGRVNRLKTNYGFPATVSNAYLGKLNNTDSTDHYARQNAQTLSRLGFNVNFAPVVDLAINPDNPVIAGIERSYSDRVEAVVRHASTWIRAHDSLGILSTLKHFPGHGSSVNDSHKGFTDVSDTWQPQELEPFRKLLQSEQTVGLMTAHVFNRQLDSLYPATLSEKVIKHYIRDEWDFDGLVFSDDLQMKAVHDLFDFEMIVRRSFEAGVDVLVFGNNLEYDTDIPRRAVRTIVDLVESDKIPEQRLRESYERIMRVKGAMK